MATPLDPPTPADRWSAIWQGTHRTAPPQETWRRLRPVLSRAGVTRVADVTSLDDLGLPVWQAVRPNAWNRPVARGTGVTHALARVSAAMGAVELRCAEEPSPRTTPAAPAEIAAELTYHWRDLPLLRANSLAPSTRIGWSPVEDLTRRTDTWAPTESIAFDLRVRSSWVPPTVRTAPEGLGAGNGLTEATLHGLLELVECHCAVTAGRLGDPWASAVAVMPDGSGTASETLAGCLRAGAVVEVADIAGELRVPAFAARVWSPTVPRWFAGVGAHPDADVALCRALTGAARSRLTAVAGVGDDSAPSHDLLTRLADTPAPRRRGPARARTVADLLGDPAQTSRGPRDLDADLDTLLELSARRDVTVLRADLTRPSYAIPVVRVLAPGLAFDSGARP
ncbi:YcaO-like family protein [Streptomyces sp. WMMC905]|uniref:YcaO-like family protein n=1 Tax=Streptomyces sp. WMMC905 TaxID=3404123 RepID=UPI003B943A0A